MIKNPFILIAFLLAIEISILYLSNHNRFKRYFSFLPSVFWIYFLPLLASTLGFIDPQSPVFAVATKYLLPASLLILLSTVDIKAIMRLGPMALVMFFVGSLGVMAGATVVFALLKTIVGPEMSSGFACLSGSWTGGSANMIAVKEALMVPDKVFTPMVIVDTIVPYVWMGLLVSGVGFQKIFDRWNGSDIAVLELFRRGARPCAPTKAMPYKLHFDKTILIVGFAIAVSFCVSFLSQFLPEVKDMISAYAWTIILVSTLGIILSFTPVKRIERYHSNKIGYFLLYFVLTTIGAKANLSNVSSVALLIGAGFLIMGIHAVFILTAARFLRAPLFLVAVASQANVGGVASAPIVAEIYQPGLASVGLLLAILGNIVGTYCGLMVAQICQLLIK